MLSNALESDLSEVGKLRLTLKTELKCCQWLGE